MERAGEIEPHGAYYCNGDDTTVLEPSRELVERFKPKWLPLVRDTSELSAGLEGNASFFSNRKLRQVVGWKHRTSWRQYLEEA
jgi:hypothetical protein